MKLPVNRSTNSCESFRDQAISPGVADESGAHHYNDGGYTNFRVYFTSAYNVTAIQTNQTGSAFQSCGTIADLKPNFSFPSTRDVLMWVPDHGILEQCSQAYKNWHQQVIDHEQGHQDELQPFADRINSNWDPSQHVLQVCATGNTEQEASGALPPAAEAYIKQYLQQYGSSLAARINQAGDQYDRAHPVSPMDCSACK